ncbi:hypothetical protein GDO86_017675 [Hymenochirus boettgeri]|uniref:BICD family-like cargo adapter 2 n=1 Tax=Hymenochirus boettgeri TaxID=247094 RepID=A0A8T2IR97_9PIPI|nr:hypothetical protein GDO86_017675 [Hymenochirus boettgeri]
MTSGGAESHVGGQEVRGGMPRSWNGILASPSMEEHFYPFISDRRSSYLAEDEEENGDEDLNLILERKDKDLLLAAELGKALLERNDQLMKERDSLEEELKESLDMLEQKKHAMRLKMEVRESEWRAQVTDLESDLAQARLQLQQLMSEQRECGKESANVVQELSEQNQRLLEQLAQTAQEEQSLNVELQSLRKENRELTFSRGQFAPCLQSLQIENTHLLEKKREMESQIKLLKDDNDSTQNQLGTAKETIYKLQMQNHELDTQVKRVGARSPELRDSQLLLQLQVKELQENCT